MAALPNVAFANVFGQTETLGAYTTLLPDEHRDPARAGSVGRPLPGVEVRVVDPETGIDVATGAVGELWVNTSQNAVAGWVHTGDLGRRDADGYIYPVGRMRDTINRGERSSDPSKSRKRWDRIPPSLMSRSPESPTRRWANEWEPLWWRANRSPRGIARALPRADRLLQAPRTAGARGPDSLQRNR